MQSEVSNSVFLTGFMGAGKSSVGKLLAALLECPFVDLDETIVQRERRTIAEIFAADGEGFFRNCEATVLNELRHQPTAIYATGGGIVMRDENRRIMKSYGRIVYLKTSWPTLKTRLQQSVDRPLVNPENGWDDVKKLWVKRQPYYEDADLVVDTDGLSPMQVAQKLVTGLTT